MSKVFVGIIVVAIVGNAAEHSTAVLAVILATFMVALAAGDGRSNWFMGAQLLAVYLILAVAFYFTPG